MFLFQRIRSKSGLPHTPAAAAEATSTAAAATVAAAMVLSCLNSKGC